MAGRFRQVGERVVYEGRLVTAVEATFEDPSGTTFERELVRHPGAVSVVALDGDGRTVILLRQYRAAVDRELLEIPAGKRDVEGEPPEVTAHRELVEEIGMRAGRLEKLAEFYNSPGFCDEHSVVYLATELEATASSAQGVEEEHMTIERVGLDDVPGLVLSGELLDAKSIIGLTLARETLARRHRSGNGS